MIIILITIILSVKYQDGKGGAHLSIHVPGMTWGLRKFQKEPSREAFPRIIRIKSNIKGEVVKSGDILRDLIRTGILTRVPRH